MTIYEPTPPAKVIVMPFKSLSDGMVSFPRGIFPTPATRHTHRIPTYVDRHGIVNRTVAFKGQCDEMCKRSLYFNGSI